MITGITGQKRIISFILSAEVEELPSMPSKKMGDISITSGSPCRRERWKER